MSVQRFQLLLGELSHAGSCLVLRIDRHKTLSSVKKVKGSATGDALIEAAIKENVDQSTMDVLAHSEVLRHAKEQGKLTVIEAEYQLDTGEVVRLDKAVQ